MKKRIFAAAIAAGMLFGTSVFAGEARLYGDYNGGVYPVEITNVQWDSIQDIPSDLSQVPNLFPDDPDFYLRWAKEIGVDHIPTFMRADAANQDYDSQNVFIETDGPAHIKFLKSGANYIKKYTQNVGESYFKNRKLYTDEYDAITNEHPEEFEESYWGHLEPITYDIPIYGMWYKKWDYDANGELLLSDEAYNWDQALAETNIVEKERCEKYGYTYTESSCPSFDNFIGMAEGDVTLEENGVYEITSADNDFLQAQGFAYELPHSYIVKVTGAKEPAPIKIDDVFVNVNGSPVSFVFDDFSGGTYEIKPIIRNGRTLVPIRAIATAFGTDVTWDADTKTVSFNYKGSSISMQVDRKEIDKNGVKTKLDVSTQIIKDRTFVPIRAVAEAFGANVSWNEETRTVDINE